MTGSRRFKKTLSLTDGRRIEELRDAARLILDLSAESKARDHWRHAAQLLAKAQRPLATDAAIEAFVSQLAFALDLEGLVSPGPFEARQFSRLLGSAKEGLPA